MIDELKELKGSSKEFKKFGLTLGVAFLILALILWIIKNPTFIYSLIAGLVFLLTAISWSMLLKPFYFLWMGIAACLGWIMTRIILTLLFYFVLTPIGIIAKIAGKDFIHRTWDRNRTSYWNEREEETDMSHYERQF